MELGLRRQRGRRARIKKRERGKQLVLRRERGGKARIEKRERKIWD